MGKSGPVAFSSGPNRTPPPFRPAASKSVVGPHPTNFVVSLLPRGTNCLCLPWKAVPMADPLGTSLGRISCHPHSWESLGGGGQACLPILSPRQPLTLPRFLPLANRPPRPPVPLSHSPVVALILPCLYSPFPNQAPSTEAPSGPDEAQPLLYKLAAFVSFPLGALKLPPSPRHTRLLAPASPLRVTDTLTFFLPARE